MLSFELTLSLAHSTDGTQLISGLFPVVIGLEILLRARAYKKFKSSYYKKHHGMNLILKLSFYTAS